jgi:hypothetical protein
MQTFIEDLKENCLKNTEVRVDSKKLLELVEGYESTERMFNAAIGDLSNISELLGCDEHETAPFNIPEILDALKKSEFEKEQLKSDFERTQRNRDMYKTQVETQVVQLEKLRSSLTAAESKLAELNRARYEHRAT